MNDKEGGAKKLISPSGAAFGNIFCQISSPESLSDMGKLMEDIIFFAKNKNLRLLEEIT